MKIIVLQKILFPSLIVLLIALTNTSQAQFAGGTGIKEDPYKVDNLEQLQAIRNHLDKHFIQVSDIEAGKSKKWNDGKGFEPIGNLYNKFTGSYNGNEFKISNLTIKREESEVGLFGYIENGDLKNITLINVDIYGRSTVGGIAGIFSGKMSNCFSSGEISGITRIAGLAGYLLEGSHLSDSASQAKITSSGSAGGLVGDNGGIIKNGNTDGVITGKIAVGGLVSYNMGDILNSFSTSNVFGDELIGGLVGISNGNITDSYASGIVTGKKQVGGLVGLGSNLIMTSNAYGDVSGDEMVGGLVGDFNFGNLVNSYARGNVSGSLSIGGLVGMNIGNITDSYARGDVTGSNRVGGLCGVNHGNVTVSRAQGNVRSLSSKGGGLIGENYGVINRSSSSGDVSGSVEVGELIGNNIGSVIHSTGTGRLIKLR